MYVRGHQYDQESVAKSGCGGTHALVSSAKQYEGDKSMTEVDGFLHSAGRFTDACPAHCGASPAHNTPDSAYQLINKPCQSCRGLGLKQGTHYSTGQGAFRTGIEDRDGG